MYIRLSTNRPKMPRMCGFLQGGTYTEHEDQARLVRQGQASSDDDDQDSPRKSPPTALSVSSIESFITL